TSTLHEDEVVTSAPQPSATTASTSNPKRQRGKQSRNQIPKKGILVIELLGTKGEPILPEGIAARFRNICGAIIKNKLQTWITTSNWKDVPTTTKDVLWATLKEKFTFCESQEKFARNFAEGLLVRCFKNWRSTLNKEYVQKGKNAREDFGRIPQEMWEEIAGLPNLFEGLDEHSRNWVLVQISTITPDGKVKFKHPTIGKIYTRLEQLAEAEPTMQLAHTGFVASSSAGSIANVRYPVDDIKWIHHAGIQPEYDWVQVVMVLDESCEIDIPTNKGIKIFGDAMNQL
uniref:Uncharacterized protein n=1 Tax=Setaria italica TaxID=4555 RepID=K3YLM1_SETIT